MKSLGLFRKSGELAYEYVFFPDLQRAVANRIPSQTGVGNIAYEVIAPNEVEAVRFLNKATGISDGAIET